MGALSDGGFVVTWSDGNGADGGSYGVYAQRYDAGGHPVGEEFQVNSYTDGTQYLSKVQGLADGGFVVVWQSNGADGDGVGISGQRYDAGGHAVGGEFVINNVAQGYQSEPSIDLRNDGALVAVWRGNGTLDQKIITDFSGEPSAVAKTLVGGDGNDRLDGLAGNDVLTGGSGSDAFVFHAGFGNDRVTDYHPGEDVIEIDRTVFVDFATLAAHAANDGSGNTVITADASNSITLLGVILDDLNAHQSDFHFVWSDLASATPG